MSSGKKVCPLITELKEKSYKAAKGHELMKYLNICNQLAVQGDTAYCEHRKHNDVKERRFVEPLAIVKDHFEMSVPRLEELVPLIEDLYEKKQNPPKVESSAAPISDADAILMAKLQGLSGASTADAGASAPPDISNLSVEDSAPAATTPVAPASTPAAAAAPTYDFSNLLPTATAAASSVAAAASSAAAAASKYDFSNLIAPAATTPSGSLVKHANAASAPPAPAPAVSATPVSDLSKRLFSPAPLDPYGMPLIPKYTDLASRTAMDDIMYPLPKPTFAPRKPLHLPSAALRAFLQASESNTARRVETCAVLLGREIKGEYYVTHMVLPEQEGSANTVTTLREELLVMFQTRMDVFTLGWVHTHPTQSCFLSSIDLHCQHAYQTGLHEAIAVVCSPHLNTTGIFAISDVGMKVMSACDKGASNFHKHDAEYGLFGNAPHVQIHYPAGHPRFTGASCARELSLPKVSGKVLDGQLPPEQVKTIGRARRCVNEVEVIDFRSGFGGYRNTGPSRKGEGVDLEITSALYPRPGFVLPSDSATTLPPLNSMLVFTNVMVESEQLSTEEKVDHAYSQVQRGADAVAGLAADAVTGSSYAIEDFLKGEKQPQGRVIGQEGDTQASGSAPSSGSEDDSGALSGYPSLEK